MTTFVALYRGATVAEAKLLAVSAAPNLVEHVAIQLLADPIINSDESDPVLRPVQQGRQRALHLVAQQNELDQNVDSELTGGASQ